MRHGVTAVATFVLSFNTLFFTGCVSGTPVKPPSGSIESKLAGRWKGIIDGDSKVTGILELSYRQVSGDAPALTGTFTQQVTHRGVAKTLVDGVKKIEGGGSVDAPAVWFLPKLAVTGREAMGVKPNPILSSQTFTFKIRLDDNNPDLIYFTFLISKGLIGEAPATFWNNQQFTRQK